MEPTTVLIPARNRRQSMDWGLVLASQEIEAEIHHDEQGWALVVNSQDQERALAAIRQYRIENRGWRWRRPLPGSGMLFHWGSLIWAIAIILFYFWSTASFPAVKARGVMDSEAVAAGQWWRLFTAVTLHANESHLLANAVTGALLLGFAMARYGAAVAVLTTFFAGAAGNVAGLIFRSESYRGLGASGMVMGALGLLAVESFSLWRKNPAATKVFLRAAAAAVLILVLLGFSPGVDIVAHVGGFVAGAIFGCLLTIFRPAVLQETVVNLCCGVVLAILVIATWWRAVQ